MDGIALAGFGQSSGLFHLLGNREGPVIVFSG
jgi:hypothetical protein